MKKMYRFVMVTMLLLSVIGGVTIYAYLSDQAESTIPLRAFHINEDYSVVPGDPIRGEPTQEVKGGVIFYPGRKVNHDAYAYIAADLSKEGWVVFIPKMPFNLAVLDADAAQNIINDHPNISRWVLSGHSLGGAMASKYAYEHPNDVEGLMLLAAYPTDENSFAEIEMPILALFGSEDGLIPAEKRADKLNLFNERTEVHLIKGGNHAQFGHYGTQKGDKPAQLSGEAQRKLVTTYMLQFLERME